MQEDHGPSAVEFREDRVEALVAQVHTVALVISATPSAPSSSKA